MNLRIYRLIIIIFFCSLCVRSLCFGTVTDSLETLLASVKHDTEKVKILNSLCIENVFSDIEKAEKYCERSLALAKETGYKEGLATAYQDMGIINNVQGNYEKAFECFSRSVEIYENISNKSGAALSLNNIGIVYQDQKNYDKALDYFNQSLKIGEEIKDKRIIAKAMSNIGIIYSWLEKPDEALECLLKTLELQKQLGDKHAISGTLNNIGAVYYTQKNSAKAIEYYLSAMDIYEELGIKSGISMALANIAIIYKDKQRYTEAKSYFEKSLVPAMEIKNNLLVKEIYKNLSEVDSSLGNYKEALRYHQLYYALNDSIFNDEYSKRLTEMQVKFETTRKENEISILKKDKLINDLELSNQKNYNYFLLGGLVALLVILALIFYQFMSKKKMNRILNLQQKELIEVNNRLTVSEYNLMESIAAKDKFFSIISHDLRGPLSAIERASVLVSNDSEKMSKDEIVHLNEEQEKAITRVNGLLENLLTWARSQTGNIAYQPEMIDLEKIITDNIELVSGHAQSKGITVKAEGSEEHFAFADPNMMNTVLRNLLTNAVKYTHKDGAVTVSCERKDEKIIVDVSDSGIGISEEILSKLFRIDSHVSRPGTSNEKGGGLGLIICKEFVEKNKGKIFVKSEAGKGSVFSFSLPVSKPT